MYACVQIFWHFEQKEYIQRTFLLCHTAGENKKDSRESESRMENVQEVHGPKKGTRGF